MPPNLPILPGLRQACRSLSRLEPFRWCPSPALRHRVKLSHANKVTRPRRTPMGRSVPRLTQNLTAARGSRARRCRTAPGHPVWLNRDPIFEEGGINLYGFSHNDCVNNVDPFGHWPGRRHYYDGQQWLWIGPPIWNPVGRDPSINRCTMFPVGRLPKSSAIRRHGGNG